MAFTPPPRAVTILDDKKFSIFGPSTGTGTPRLFFGVTNNGNPYAMVFTNDPNDTEKTPIRAAMDPVIWGAFVSTCKAVWADPKFPCEVRMENKTGKPTATMTDTVSVIGRDDKGVCYIAILKKGRPAKRFSILPTIYMNLVDRDGNQVPEGRQSELFAPGWLASLDFHVNDLVAKMYKPFEGNAPNKGGGYNKQPANNTHSSSNNHAFDDDIPF